MEPKRYITQLTFKDMKEIAAAVNMKQGWLVRIDREADAIKISIDYTALVLAMQEIFGLTPRN